MRWELGPISGVLALLLGGCLGAEAPPDVNLCASGDVRSVQQPLVNGESDSEGHFDAVVCVGGAPRADGSTAPCGSGTLVSSRHILTARHLGGLNQGARLRFQFGPEARDEPRHVVHGVRCWEFRKSGPAPCCNHSVPETPEQMEAYQDSCEAPLAADDYVISDLALWELEQPVPSHADDAEAHETGYFVTPIPVALEAPDGRSDSEGLKGLNAVTVGFGSSDHCNFPQTRSGVRRFGGVRITDSFTSDASRTGAGDYVLHDDTDLKGERREDWPLTAPGDSGGPLLLEYGADEADDCTRVSSFRVVGTTRRGCNYSWASTLVPEVSEGLRILLSVNADQEG